MGQKAMAGECGANLGEEGGLKGDAGALLMDLQLATTLANRNKCKCRRAGRQGRGRVGRMLTDGMRPRLKTELFTAAKHVD